MSDYLLTFYGDDFTGSTDVMEALVLGGVPTVLLLETPDPNFIREQFPHVRAIGVAGTSRAMTPTEMTAELQPKFTALKALDAPLFHYKICSTFDSSPTIGSIGHAIEIGCDIFQPEIVPLLVGAPTLKRYVVFGNLFATVGEQTYRLDRHPTMSKHPVTPMAESDLRLHLGKQTARKIGLIDIRQLDTPYTDVAHAYHILSEQGNEIILFDTIDNQHLQIIGQLLGENQPPFIVGSSGVEYALTGHWRETGVVQEVIPLPKPGAVDQLIVMCGSAAPTTKAQIEWALEQGFVGIRLETAALVDPHSTQVTIEQVLKTALDILGQGKSIILYSALGPDDPAIAQTRERLQELALDSASVSTILGKQQGIILKSLLTRTGLRRVCVAGGDTSGQVAQQLGIFALEIITPIAPGAPLCRASSYNPALHGLEIAFKGGQNGDKTYFGAIQRGQA